MTGKIESTPGLINQDTGMINDNTGLIENSTGLTIDRTGLINDTNDAKYTVNGRRKRSRERGKDNKPRNYPLHTMKNLPQFRNKSHEEVRQYILENKGVDIGGIKNWNKTVTWILIATAIVVGGIGVWKWWQQRQERKSSEDTIKTNPINY